MRDHAAVGNQGNHSVPGAHSILPMQHAEWLYPGDQFIFLGCGTAGLRGPQQADEVVPIVNNDLGRGVIVSLANVLSRPFLVFSLLR